ncbi:tol-pal system protein YbgF [uncultured Halopseudomonas sp.]|uniref:tol-pal system protein YbgF n=1 Tax=uncultured Halopseudomonas sp. TaxID=2901193 RepID=UPI0030EF7A1D|tara:strand:- start:22500 stop:23312 length:813 start_codon:yes stop_codon:yes gene_type:complete
MKGFRGLTVALMLLPIAAMAQVPVIDGSAGGVRGSQSSTPASPQATAGTSIEGQLLQQLYQLQQEVAMLRGRLEEQEYRVKQMEQDQLDQYQDIDRRLSAGAGAAPSQTDQQAPIDARESPAASQPGNNGGATAPQGSTGAAEVDPAREKLMYDAAFDLVKARDFEKAIQAFSAFVRRFPNSEYAGNAQYWLGEIHLVESNLDSAGRAFALVISEYPGHRKEADALYKLADVERRLGNRDKAIELYQQVLTRHPNSSAAQLARRDLDGLG